ncbi:hypothetical protein [Arthrobacter sp. CJ23]|uniref:hypothetical protein n=1 Tax=Arthrobacter sp. CJ23 TaxID=2972479 RepID=UPI00215BF555|nr:hypothetical protein [Arthrobacter sp. CJ23]UVJ39037.1 hypothetical protein NVV90_17775 [Arthrobacter sp. CJ23]
MNDSASHPDPVPDPTTGFRRRSSAIALPVAFVCQLVCNALYAGASTSTGLSSTGGAAGGLELAAAAPDTMLAAVMFALVGSLLAVLGLPAALRLLRPARPRLALWAVALMVTGYISYFGISFANLDWIALATNGVDAAAALDASPAGTWGQPFYLLFAIGNLVGTLLLGLAVILAGRAVGVRWWAGALIICWTIGHVINIIVGNEWFAVAGGALEIVGLTFVAAAVWRSTNADWVARG